MRTDALPLGSMDSLSEFVVEIIANCDSNRAVTSDDFQAMARFRVRALRRGTVPRRPVGVGFLGSPREEGEGLQAGEIVAVHQDAFGLADDGAAGECCVKLLFGWPLQRPSA
jgi:hypothetical protein